MNAAASHEDVPSLFVADQGGAGAPAGRCRILLVEDDAVDRMALRRHIAQHRLDYELTEVASVGEARRRLAAGQFDLLLLDYNLPDGTGFDLIEPANGAPAVFLAGSDNLELAVRAIRAGAADYLVKDTARAYLTMLPFTVTRVMQQRRTEAALRASQAQLRRLLDCLPTAAFACDAQGLITYFNDQTPLLWGRVPRLHDPEDRFCRSLRFSRMDGTPVDHEQCWRAFTGRREVLAESLVVESATGERREVLAYANPMFDAQGVLTGVINLWVDVTAMRKLERRQRALEAHVAHSRKLEAVGTLAGGVAHEFNNLLTSIMGNLQLAEMDLPAEHAACGVLGEALASSRRARDLVQQMLNFSRQTDDRPEIFLIEQVVADAVELVAHGLARNVELRTKIMPEAPPCSGRAGEIHQAVVQLAENSLQAMRAAGGVLEIGLGRLGPDDGLRQRHTEIRPEHTLRLWVRDTGPGMEAAVVERLFEPFFTTRPPGQGTGLGLAGIYGTIMRHRGAVVAESAPGAGTTVSLFFPAAGVRFAPCGPAGPSSDSAALFQPDSNAT